MSEQLDYLNSRVEQACGERISHLLQGNIKTIEDLQFNRGYLKAMQDIQKFQLDYITLKNPRKEEEEDD